MLGHTANFQALKGLIQTAVGKTAWRAYLLCLGRQQRYRNRAQGKTAKGEVRFFALAVKEFGTVVKTANFRTGGMDIGEYAKRRQPLRAVNPCLL